MTIYNYDNETKEFISTSDARVNPLEQGSFLIPANATSKQVIEENQGFARCFIDNNWTYIEDNRGQYKVTNYSPLELELITDLGIIDNKASDLDTKEDGSYYTYYNENGTVDTIKEVEEEQLRLKAEADAQQQYELSNLKVTISSGKVFYADSESRTDLISAIDGANLRGETQAEWKLAEEYNGFKITTVTLTEIREALALALEGKAKIIGVI